MDQQIALGPLFLKYRRDKELNSCKTWIHSFNDEIIIFSRWAHILLQEYCRYSTELGITSIFQLSTVTDKKADNSDKGVLKIL